MRHGVRGLVIDPYNEIEHRRPANMTETEYVSQILGKVKRFAQNHGVHVWFVAHPVKLPRENGKVPVPTLYDISGSANWANKADIGFAVYRNDQAQQVEIYVQKVRHKWAGKIGRIELVYDKVTGRYSSRFNHPPAPRAPIGRSDMDGFVKDAAPRVRKTLTASPAMRAAVEKLGITPAPAPPPPEAVPIPPPPVDPLEAERGPLARPRAGPPWPGSRRCSARIFRRYSRGRRCRWRLVSTRRSSPPPATSSRPKSSSASCATGRASRAISTRSPTASRAAISTGRPPANRTRRSDGRR